MAPIRVDTKTWYRWPERESENHFDYYPGYRVGCDPATGCRQGYYRTAGCFLRVGNSSFPEPGGCRLSPIQHPHRSVDHSRGKTTPWVESPSVAATKGPEPPERRPEVTASWWVRRLKDKNLRGL